MISFPGRRLRAALVLVLSAWMFTGSWRALALDDTKPLRSYGHQNWQTGSGLPQSTVHAILQTRDGFLWLATEGGLLRFDGVDFSIFDTRTVPALRSNLVLSLAEASDGTLLAGTAAGLLTIRQGRMHLFTSLDGLPGASVMQVTCGAKESCWIITAEGVAAWKAGQLRSFAVTPALGSNEQPIAAHSRDGSLWVATARGLAHLQDSGAIERIPLPAPISSFAVAGDGSIFAGSRGKLFRYHGQTLTTKIIPQAAGITTLLASAAGPLYLGTQSGLVVLGNGPTPLSIAKPILPGTRITNLLEDRDGALWIGTESGLGRLYGDKAELLPLGEGSSGSGAVLSLLEDREGDLWFGTDAGGLTVLRDRTFTTYTTADGLPGNNIRSIYAGRDGVIWAGGSGTGLSRSMGNAFTLARNVANGLSSNTVLALAGTATGALFVGTPDGLDLLQHSLSTRITSAEGLPDDLIRSLLATSKDELWIGTRHGLARWKAPQDVGNPRFEVYSAADGLGSDVVGALEEDRKDAGAVWAGTLGGLSHIDAAGHVTTLAAAQGLTFPIVTALLQQADGTLWIGTGGGGLYRLRDSRITAYAPAETGLPETISSILDDESGRLWLGTPSGIYRVPTADLNFYAQDSRHSVVVTAFGVSDGLLIPECSNGHPSAVRAVDGALWFATLRGISTVTPGRMRENTLPPPVAIEDVAVDDQSVPADRPFRIPPGRSRLAIHYAGLSFAAPSKVRYQYRLEGFDKHWIDAGPRRTAYYTNIPPGRYTFRVLAANNDGIWNESGAAIDFSVAPHYYQTWWFYTLLTFALAVIGYAAYRLRVRAVEQRFSAVLGERNRIAREIHDTLAQDIVAISVQLELASRLLSSSVEAARTQLDSTRALVKSSLAEARTSIWNLRSAPADANDLPGRLNQSGKEIASGAALQFTLKVNGAYRAAPPGVEDELVRIAREAMQNAARHAAATRIDTTLSYSARNLQLTVADDGAGFEENAAAFVSGGHFGLQGMRERARAIGAKLHVESRPGEGTRISVLADIP